ncbi:MAG: hypothetical protein SFY92_10450 [Verrucomicrobiae bacterium]|nr:hypothetical protein [Verrucomicrobiae bacterium]
MPTDPAFSRKKKPSSLDEGRSQYSFLIWILTLLPVWIFLKKEKFNFEAISFCASAYAFFIFLQISILFHLISKIIPPFLIKPSPLIGAIT